MKEIIVGFWWIWFCIFFSGYVITYAIAHLLSKYKRWGNYIKAKVYPLLPLSYAFTTTCFWVFILFKGNLLFISKRVAHSPLAQVIIEWSLLALLFWLPFLRKKKYFSFIHSIPFFILPLIFIGKSIIRYSILERDDIFNLLRIYLTGFSIYVAALIILMLAKFVFLHLTAPKHHAV